MAKDLRTFLKEYEAKYPEDVLHIDKEIDSDQEITAIILQLEKLQKSPLLIFHNVLNAEGKRAKQPLVINVLSSRTRRARICNAPIRTLGRVVSEATRMRRVAPVVVAKADAPLKEVIKTGDQINLLEFPAPKYGWMDAGHYISAGFLTTYDLDTGTDNCAIIRGWLKEKDIMRVSVANRPQHTGQNLYKHELQNQDMKVAFWLGHHPLAYIGGLARLPYPGSHWEAMGGILGEPLRLVASESLGDDFLVPADAEIVVEGILKANQRYPEAPFPEFTGYFGSQKPSPEVKVTAITHRKDAIWYSVSAASADHAGTGATPIEGMLWDHLKPRFPSLQNVYMPLSGIGRYHAYLQFKNPGPGQAKQAIIYALGLHPAFFKHVFTFDDDVDIFNEREVMWAIATRSQWSRDVVILPQTKTVALDPSTLSGVVGDLGGIDCTKPWGEPYAERVGVSPEVMAKIKLEDFVSPEALARVKTEAEIGMSVGGTDDAGDK